LMFIKMFTVNYLLFLGCLQESNMQWWTYRKV
jgi:hypothetical protein